MNVDLCFVPATHAPAELLPAVSGSSGRLLVSRPKGTKEERSWPGQVFEREGLSYAEAMDRFVALREAKRAAEGKVAERGDEGLGDQKGQRRVLRSEIERLRVARREERARRRMMDRVWKGCQHEHGKAAAAVSGVKRAGPRSTLGKKRGALKGQWRAAWAERHEELARRRAADERWRQERAELRQREQALGLRAVCAWIAVLVIVDNCTRQSLGLPMFVMGAHVTAALVVEALEVLLPKELKYLIADGGVHFTADVIKKLAEGRGFVRVPLAKHRPQSNGIAERFVETLKAWLSDKEWQTAEELAALLGQFVAYYNDRPHQGYELAGLSPNEYVARKLAA